MKEIFSKHGIDLSEGQLQKFELFLELFVQTNAEINLSAIREADEIITKHFIDSLMLTKFFPEILNSEFGILNFLDLGTGGGFPGIPLAIFYPDHHFTLLDARRKKCLVIKEFVEKLGLGNVSIAWGRAEDPATWEFITGEKRGSFHFVVSRATAMLSKLITWSKPVLKTGGKLIAYKTPSLDELDEVSDEITSFFYELEGQDRNLLVIEK